MIISDDIKAKIEKEFKEWEAVQYAGLSKEERQKRAAYFTPPKLSIKMAEKFDSVKDKDILDPAAGAGGLLVVMIFCGADPTKIYGIELDPKIANICRVRLAKLGVLRHHIHVGNALDESSYEFPKSSKVFDLKITKNNNTLNVKCIVMSRDNKMISYKSFSLTTVDGKVNLNNVQLLHKILSSIIEKEIECTSNANSNINALNKLFLKMNLPEI